MKIQIANFNVSTSVTCDNGNVLDWSSYTTDMKVHLFIDVLDHDQSVPSMST